MAGFNKMPFNKKGDSKPRSNERNSSFRTNRNDSHGKSFNRDNANFDREPSNPFERKKNVGKSSSFGADKQGSRNFKATFQRDGSDKKFERRDNDRSFNRDSRPSNFDRPNRDNRGGFERNNERRDNDRSFNRDSRPSNFDRPNRDNRGGFDKNNERRDNDRSFNRDSRPSNFDRPNRDNRGGFDKNNERRDNDRSFNRDSRPSNFDRPNRDNRGGFDKNNERRDNDRSFNRDSRPSNFDRPNRDNRGGFDKNNERRDNDRSFNRDSRPSNFDRLNRENRGGFDKNNERRDNDRSFNRDSRPSNFDRPNRDNRGGFDKNNERRDNDRSFNRDSRPSNFDRPRREKNNDFEKTNAKYDTERRKENKSDDDFFSEQEFFYDDDFFPDDNSNGKNKTSKKQSSQKETTRFDEGMTFSLAEKPKKAQVKEKMEEVVEDDEQEEDMRLNKFVALSGLASRRTAAEMIKNGEIAVNDTVIKEPGYRVQLGDIVKHKGSIIQPIEDLIYILLNKPKNVITTVSDEQGRKTVMDIVENATDKRIYPVGRLDRDTTGLLLITNDGDLARKLSHPSHDVKKIYQVTLDKPVTGRHLDMIAKGLELEDGMAEVDAVGYIEGGSKNEVGIEIHIGKNRIVRRIFEHLGYTVEKLDRVYYAGLTKKDLPRGRWRNLSEQEVIMLKHFV